MADGLGKMNFCISIDTFYPEVAKYALDNGASIINDVSGKFNPEMAKIVREYKCGWIITHTAESDSSHPVEYKEGVISAVNGFIDDMTDKLISASIDLDQIVFDPGIGFGKTCDDDLIILKEFDKLNHNRPLLLACSNKRVIGYLSCADINNRLYGTVAANVSSVLKGADFIRVHDVKANKLAVSLADVLRS